MKISLRWLCDHIAGTSWDRVDMTELATGFNAKVAEIEHVDCVAMPVDAWFAACVYQSYATEVVLVIAQTGESVRCSLRTDLSKHTNAAYLVTKGDNGYRWVTLKDVGLDKDGLLPALLMSESEIAGAWREQWEAQDWILDVDNKSLTHRPDMWGHRGFAREVAALLGLRLVDEKTFLAPEPVIYIDQQEHQAVARGVSLSIDTSLDVCSALGGCVVPSVVMMPCDIRAVSRLVKIGYRPLNAIVDMTNYAMADWGHPMHAYDADRVSGHMLQVRKAQGNEKLDLLDGSTLTLSEHDVVVCDAEKVLGLAGIMGGKHDSVTASTQALLLEAACFHAATIRRSAARHKLRTESSQRFEKTLDPEQISSALLRVLFLARVWGVIAHDSAHPITIIGKRHRETIITISHVSILERLGVELTADQVCDLLNAIDLVTTQHDGLLKVIVPSYRATKDITGAHDIVEEVARWYGFNAITPKLPALVKRAHSLRSVMRLRRLKEYCAYSAGMREQRNYGFFSEPILRQLAWEASEGIMLKNPVSADAHRLVNSLIPHLLENVMNNMASHEQCAFFEWGTVWNHGTHEERSDLSGVWFSKRGGLDFYRLKHHVSELCRLSGAVVSWHAAAPTPAYQWLDMHKAAALHCGGRLLGVFGKIASSYVQRMGGLPESECYAFELDGTWLLQHHVPMVAVPEERKYQHSSFDLSVLVSSSLTVAELEHELASVNEVVTEVQLIDFFEKKEWVGQRSLAFRVTLSHKDRTISREEFDRIRNQSIAILVARGAQLRS